MRYEALEKHDSYSHINVEGTKNITFTCLNIVVVLNLV